MLAIVTSFPYLFATAAGSLKVDEYIEDVMACDLPKKSNLYFAGLGYFGNGLISDPLESSGWNLESYNQILCESLSLLGLAAESRPDLEVKKLNDNLAALFYRRYEEQCSPHGKLPSKQPNALECFRALALYGATLGTLAKLISSSFEKSIRVDRLQCKSVACHARMGRRDMKNAVTQVLGRDFARKPHYRSVLGLLAYNALSPLVHCVEGTGHPLDTLDGQAASFALLDFPDRYVTVDFTINEVYYALGGCKWLLDTFFQKPSWFGVYVALAVITVVLVVALGAFAYCKICSQRGEGKIETA